MALEEWVCEDWAEHSCKKNGKTEEYQSTGKREEKLKK